MTYIIAGLGNPEEEYIGTRHNTGRIVLEGIKKIISKDSEFSDWDVEKKKKALRSEGKVGKEKVLLLEPNDFMNNSGSSVKPFIKSKKDAEHLIIIHDDLDLPIGSHKISFNRGSGGHKGVESIIKNIKTEAFLRFRIGISPKTPSGKLKKPKGEDAVGKFIMGEFKTAELEELKKLSKKLAEATISLVNDGREKMMSLYN